MPHAPAPLPSPDGVCVLVGGDEEIGSATSRELIEEAVRGCRAARLHARLIEHTAH